MRWPALPGNSNTTPTAAAFAARLFTVTRNKLKDAVARAHRHPAGSGDTGVRELLEQQAQPADDQTLWDEEYQRRLLDWAAECVRREVQESTWQAFWQTAVEGRPPEEVAQRLAMSTGAVYIAKSRVIARIRQCIKQRGDL